MKPYERPSDEACALAAERFELAAQALLAVTYKSNPERYWSKAIGHLQEGLAELGLDLTPLKQPAPATAEAYGLSDYAASRGADPDSKGQG